MTFSLLRGEQFSQIGGRTEFFDDDFLLPSRYMRASVTKISGVFVGENKMSSWVAFLALANLSGVKCPPK